MSIDGNDNVDVGEFGYIVVLFTDASTGTQSIYTLFDIFLLTPVGLINNSGIILDTEYVFVGIKISWVVEQEM